MSTQDQHSMDKHNAVESLQYAQLWLYSAKGVPILWVNLGCYVDAIVYAKILLDNGPLSTLILNVHTSLLVTPIRGNGKHRRCHFKTRGLWIMAFPGRSFCFNKPFPLLFSATAVSLNSPSCQSNTLALGCRSTIFWILVACWIWMQSVVKAMACLRWFKVGWFGLDKGIAFRMEIDNRMHIVVVSMNTDKGRAQRSCRGIPLQGIRLQIGWWPKTAQARNGDGNKGKGDCIILFGISLLTHRILVATAHGYYGHHLILPTHRVLAFAVAVLYHRAIHCVPILWINMLFALDNGGADVFDGMGDNRLSWGLGMKWWWCVFIIIRSWYGWDCHIRVLYGLLVYIIDLLHKHATKWFFTCIARVNIFSFWINPAKQLYDSITALVFWKAYGTFLVCVLAIGSEMMENLDWVVTRENGKLHICLVAHCCTREYYPFIPPCRYRLCTLTTWEKYLYACLQFTYECVPFFLEKRSTKHTFCSILGVARHTDGEVYDERCIATIHSNGWYIRPFWYVGMS